LIRRVLVAVETDLGLCASRGSRTVDASAGDGVLVVADGMGDAPTSATGC